MPCQTVNLHLALIRQVLERLEPVRCWLLLLMHLLFGVKWEALERTFLAHLGHWLWWWSGQPTDPLEVVLPYALIIFLLSARAPEALPLVLRVCIVFPVSDNLREVWWETQACLFTLCRFYETYCDVQAFATMALFSAEFITKLAF